MTRVDQRLQAIGRSLMALRGGMRACRLGGDRDMARAYCKRILELRVERAGLKAFRMPTREELEVWRDRLERMPLRETVYLMTKEDKESFERLLRGEP